MFRISKYERGLYEGTIVTNRQLCREHFLLTIRVAEFPDSVPGQFIQLGCRSPRPDDIEGQTFDWTPTADQTPPTFSQPELLGELAFLRRPFSLAGHRKTELGSELDIIHRVVGVGTDWLSTLNEGDEVDLVGPLGNAFVLPENRSIGLMVGGGVGLPPMYYLAEGLAAAGYGGCAFVGAMSSDLLAITPSDEAASENGDPRLSVAEFARHGFPCVVTTNDGSSGMSGLITDGLKRYIENQTEQQRSQTVIYTCGPEPMMHAVHKLATAFGIDCQACMEQAMACGMATCQSCVVKIKESDNPHAHLEDGTPWRYRLACTDGPVFDANEIIWS